MCSARYAYDFPSVVLLFDREYCPPPTNGRVRHADLKGPHPPALPAEAAVTDTVLESIAAWVAANGN